MNKIDLIPIAIGITVIVVSTVLLSYALTPIQESIMYDLHTPTNIDVLPANMNEDLTCHKVGLYTDWDEGWGGGLSALVTGIYVGEHARQMFFEYGCYYTCHEYWESEKVCIAELFPHE